MQYVLCEHFKYASIIEFWYVLRGMNTISFDIYDSTLANFIPPYEQHASWPILWHILQETVYIFSS